MLKRLFSKLTKPEPVITVVSGLPRSGTSMMMKMLDAGGIPPVQDGIRTADSDNPKGYYEFERVKKLDKGDHTWLPDAKGKAVKVISALLVHLPTNYTYKVLFMRRNINEVLASQAKMLKHRGENQSVEDEKMKALYAKHLAKVENWMRQQPTVHVMDVDYGQLVRDPLAQLPAINDFLGGNLDVPAMASVVDPSLYRNRK